MKLLFLAALPLFAAGLAGSLRDAQDPQDGPKPDPKHAMLFAHVGTWDAVIVTAGPGGEEQRSKAVMKTRRHGTFHTVDDFEGSFMGEAFTGHGMSSWCPVRKKFVSSWTDSMVPSPLHLTGDYDGDTKQLVMTGEAVGTSGKLEPCRTVTYYQTADRFAWEMYGTGPDGKEIRQLRIEYTRRK